jgi:peptidoglycan hydrolase CwlO-like protein
MRKNMNAKLLSLVMVLTMISTIGGTSVFARTATDTRSSGQETKTSSGKASPVKGKAAENSKLKADVQKLLADAKAGKVAPRSQKSPNGGRYNLGTGAKIGIAVAIAGAIVAIILLHVANSD